jgi:hypothetical protein
MDEAWRERVRERAYALWLREGSPDGRAEQFWLMAEEELLAAEGPDRSGGPPDEGADRSSAAMKAEEEVSDGSSPASAPVARTGGAGADAPPRAQTPRKR